MHPGGQFSTRITGQFLAGVQGVPRNTVHTRLLLFDFETGQSAVHFLREQRPYGRGMRKDSHFCRSYD
jgi:hypothetical protein